MTLLGWLILAVAVLAVAIYLAVFLREMPDVADEDPSSSEPPPEDLGHWRADELSPAGRDAKAEGLRREVRVWMEADEGTGSARLLEQVRYRSLETREVVRDEPERVIKRRRLNIDHS